MTAPSESTSPLAPFPFTGDPAFAAPVTDALRRVLDPELGLSIVDLGLVYGFDLADGVARIRLTMTSAGCPLTDLIFDEVEAQLGPVLPPQHVVEFDLCWDPPWTPDRMSASARARLGW